MSVKIRLKKMGRKKRPFYRLVAIDSRKRRDGLEVERLGWYNPDEKDLSCQMNEERILYWLGQGAQPSDTVSGLFRRYGLSYKWELIKSGAKGEKVDNPVKHASGYIDYIKEYFDTKVFPKVKSEKGKQVKTDQMNSIISDTKKNLQVIKNCLILHNHLVDAKMMIVDKLNNGAKKFPNTFVRTNSGYKVVNDEGYVAIDKMSGGAVKLVDRLEFSYNNFNGIKNWDK